LSRIAIAAGSLSDLDTLRREFASVADLRVGDIAQPAALAELTDAADALVVSLHPITAAHVASLPRSVQVIVRAGVGLDSIDVSAAHERGIAVVNQPAYAVAEVADHAVAMLLACHRSVATYDRAVRSGEWPPAPSVGEIPPTDELALGLIGYGRIGRAVADRLRPSVRAVHVFDVAYDGAADTPVVAEASLDDLLRAADLVSVHLPLTARTRGIVGARELDLLPADALLVNVSRGGLVDEAALADALAAGRLRGAAIDVFETEPLPADSPLRSAPRLLMSPHVAWYSTRSASRLARWSLEDAIAYASGSRDLHGVVVKEAT
jgi:D-3-phosphoglycerate dehydrogenase